MKVFENAMATTGASLVVDKGTGDMTLAIAGDDIAFVVFGVCQAR